MPLTDRNEYFTFDEAVDHIMQVERCSRRSAQRKLRKALADGKIDWKFEDGLQDKLKLPSR